MDMGKQKISWLFTIGMLLIYLTMEGKKAFPATIGHSTVLMWGSSVIAAACFGLMFFFTMEDFFLTPRCSWKAVAMVTWGLLSFIFLPALNFAVYAGFSAIRSSLVSIQPPSDLLAKLMQAAYEAKSEPKRLDCAMAAYRMYGVSLPYRKDDGTESVYVSTSIDEQGLALSKQNQAKTREVIGTFDNQLRQLRWLFALDTTTSFATFIAAIIWFAVRRSRAPEVRSPA
jgi:hypothetical protein